MGQGVRGFTPAGGTTGTGSCCGGSSSGQASACCQRGMGIAGGGQGSMLDIIEELRKLAQQDPASVAQALRQNPQFAQLLSSVLGQQQQSTTVQGVGT